MGLAPRVAVAEPVRADPPPASTADLDGVVLAVGPLGSAIVRDEDGGDGTFGGEVLLARFAEHAPLSVAGLSVGGARFAAVERGHVWAEVVAGSTWPLGIPIGLAGGATLELDEVRPPRWGWHGTLWAYVGAAPYLRVGQVERSGTFAEIGVRIPLPALRWR